MEAKQRAEHLVLKFGTIGTCCWQEVVECPSRMRRPLRARNRFFSPSAGSDFFNKVQGIPGLGTGFDLHSP